nr:helix-turn-helix transcriptional regulator [Raoultibacter phocaeensis]
MNIADRIQHLRKVKGVSQEELADKIGVSRQAVSKWESEQSIPDIDKIIIMSTYFDVTTDYLLKGIESPCTEDAKRPDARIFAIVGTVLNFVGVVIAAALWYEQQQPMALVVGLVFMALGCMVFGVGMINSDPRSKTSAQRTFWIINVWLIAFMPLSFVYNVLFTGTTAPYPLLTNPIIAFPLFWLVYIAFCLVMVYFQVRRSARG